MVLNNDEKEVVNGYFEWLLAQVDTPNEDFKYEYSRLMSALFGVTYTWEFYLNEDRAVDGMNLRERYDIFNGSDVTSILRFTPCSVLECLVALFTRCSDEIASEPGDESVAPGLFYDCLSKLGLLGFDDFCVNFDAVYDILEDFCDEKLDIFELRDRVLGKKRHDLWYVTCKFVMEKMVGKW